MKKLHLAHIINPVKLPVYGELTYTQPITFESMRVAKARASDLKIDLLTTQYPEDHEIIPDYFYKTPDLERSVLAYRAFTRPKKLPILSDIVQRLYEGSEADYLIYTNVDIAVQPHFYLEIAKRIEDGLDAFIINRRRIPGHFTALEELPQMYAHRGKSHPGFDCFVFHRSLYEKFHFEKICVGIPFSGIIFSQNLFCYAKRYKLFAKDFLTFHVGMEIFKKRDMEYFQFNREQFWNAIGQMWPDLDSAKFPWGNYPMLYRLIRWGLHPSIPIRLALRLEPRRWRSLF